MATVNGVGGDEPRSVVREREGSRGGEGRGERGRGPGGYVSTSREGQSEAASRRWRGAYAWAAATRPRALWHEVEDDWQSQVGCAG